MLVGVPREVKDHEYRVSTIEAIEQEIATADVVIGAVLIPGASAPKLVTRDMLNLMKPRAALADVAIPPAGCFATRPDAPRVGHQPATPRHPRRPPPHHPH